VTISGRNVVVTMGEYETVRSDAHSPTDGDLRLADHLMSSGTDVRLGVRWLADGRVEVASSSWVGVVRFSQIEIRVVPKFVGGSLQVLRMLDYCSGVGMLRYLPSESQLPSEGNDLFDLICLLLARESEMLIREGLLRGYREVEEVLTVLKGRLRYRDQFMRRFGRLDQLECRFDDYDTDVLENHLVAAALRRARPRARDHGIRFSVSRFAAVFEEACQPLSFDPDWYESRLNYHRGNGRYRPAHELAKLVLQGRALEDIYDASGVNTNAFLIDMNKVFEKFVSLLITEAIAPTSLGVIEQQRLGAIIRDDRTDRSYSTIVPDLVIHDRVSGRSIPIDIKYKLYEAQKFSTSDIFQAFVYAYALADDASERRAGILFPASKSIDGPRLSIRPSKGPAAARIAGGAIDVPRALSALHDPPARAELLADVRALVADITGFEIALDKSPSRVA
jgi:5-methylcytosine-specific restriction enzyme subunit McrC